MKALAPSLLAPTGFTQRLVEDEDDGAETLHIELPGSDPIICANGDDLDTATTIIEVAVRWGVDDDDLWSLLCAGVGR